MITNEKGFTLLELMIVVAIVAIVATMAFPSFESYRERAKLKRAGRELYSDFQRTRISALRDNKAYGIEFDGTGYKILDLGADDDWGGTGDDADNELKSVVLSDYGHIAFGIGTGAGEVPDDTVGVGTSGNNFADSRARFIASIDTTNPASQNFVYLNNTNTQDTMAVEVFSTTGRVKLWANWNGAWEDQ